MCFSRCDARPSSVLRLRWKVKVRKAGKVEPMAMVFWWLHGVSPKFRPKATTHVQWSTQIWGGLQVATGKLREFGTRFGIARSGGWEYWGWFVSDSEVLTDSSVIVEMTWLCVLILGHFPFLPLQFHRCQTKVDVQFLVKWKWCNLCQQNTHRWWQALCASNNSGSPRRWSKDATSTKSKSKKSNSLV